MLKARCLCTTAIFLTLSSIIAPGWAQDYTIQSGKELLNFIPKPEIGYVVKAQDNPISIESIENTLQTFGITEVNSVKGLDHGDISVVLDNRSPIENQENLRRLTSNNQVKYTAPLFSVNDQIVAVIPEIVVRLAFENTLTELQSLCDELDLSIIKQMEYTKQEYLLAVQGTDANAVFSAIERLNQIDFVEWAVPNTAFKLKFFEQILPNDEYFPRQWHLNNTGQTNGTPNADVNVPKAWEMTTGDPNIIVAIVDTGVDVNHPDLINNIVPGYDFFDDDNDPNPSLDYAIDGHGTNCAGLAAAQGNNNIGVAGVAWNCKIMPIRIADAENFITDADIATAFRWAAEHGADILSNSWGGLYSSQILYSAILDITQQGGIGRDGKGCILFFAAGNWEDGGPVDYPASRPEVIAVGATDHDDEIWYYSASGPELDIVAPSGGGRIEDYFIRRKPYLWTTDIMDIFGYSMYNLDQTILDYSDTMSGTSGACPLVAGVAALVLSADPNLRNIDVRRILLDTAIDLGEPGFDENYGFGRVDAYKAVDLALNPPPIPPTSFITYYVDDDAMDDPGPGDPNISDPNENGTLEHPFDSIQKAIDYSLYSETIIVLPGTYSGAGNYDIDFSGKPLKIRSETGPENCIIDCKQLGRGFYFHNSERETSELEGFTITNGKAYDGAGINCSNSSSPILKNLVFIDNFAYSWGQIGGNGGGIFIGSSCNPSIIDCTFTDNSAVWYGGGLFNNYGNPALENCIFNENKAGHYGGGLLNDSGRLTLSDCIISYNTAETLGGGMYNVDAGPTLTNCDFIGNIAFEWDGGAFFNDYGNPIFTNCNFINNSSGDWGGAILNTSGSPEFFNCVFSANSSQNYGGAFYDDWGYPEFTNCIIADNSTTEAGGAMYFDYSDPIITNCTFTNNTADSGNAIACDSWWFMSNIIINNSILWDGTDQISNNDSSVINITYSDVQTDGDPWAGQGNINIDPLFADSSNGDYHLKSQAGRWDPINLTWIQDPVTSPCIDAGDPDSNVAGELPPNGGRINMGAYGGTSEASLSPNSDGG